MAIHQIRIAERTIAAYAIAGYTLTAYEDNGSTWSATGQLPL